jgi:hypothetical protein
MSDGVNNSPESAGPRRWAVALLRAFLWSQDEETVSGDLIEEYRDTICPSRGRWRADLWFVRQIAGFAGRAGVGWGVLLGVLWIVGPFRMLLAQSNWPRFEVEPKLIAGIVCFLAARRAWRSGRSGAGISVAVGIAVAGSATWITGVALQAARWDSTLTPLQSLRHHMTWTDLLVIPVLSLVFATMAGTIGAAAGKLLLASFGRRSI